MQDPGGLHLNVSKEITHVQPNRQDSFLSVASNNSVITNAISLEHNGSARTVRLLRGQSLPARNTTLVTKQTTFAHQPPRKTDEPPTPARPGDGLYKFTKVLLLSYQRSGSTVVGDVLFNRNQAVMYSYEPLDALYNSMYGTEPGWNVPADITITPFGELRWVGVPPGTSPLLHFLHTTAIRSMCLILSYTSYTIKEILTVVLLFRQIPEFEMNAVSEYLSNLLSCNLNNMPAEYFIHPFWYSFSNHTDSTKSYTTCLKKRAVSYKALYFCQRHILFLCGKRFGDARSRRNVCSNLLLPSRKTRRLLYTQVRRGMGAHGERYHDISMRFPKFMSSSRPMEGYKMCLAKYTRRAESCSRTVLPDTCSKRKVHAIKTVRGTMASADKLLQSHPDFFLIHLVRDPRGVVLSRRKSGWSQGFYGRGKVRALAKTYCTTVLDDIRHRKSLEKKYPHRIHSVLMDQFFEEPEKHVREIYGKIGLTVPTDVTQYLNLTIKSGVADKWMEKLTREEINDITNECSDVYKEIIQ